MWTFLPIHIQYFMLFNSCRAEQIQMLHFSIPASISSVWWMNCQTNRWRQNVWSGNIITAIKKWMKYLRQIYVARFGTHKHTPNRTHIVTQSFRWWILNANSWSLVNLFWYSKNTFSLYLWGDHEWFLFKVKGNKQFFPSDFFLLLYHRCRR